jgi:hypothetical protein
VSAKVDWRTCATETLGHAREFYAAYLANSDGLAWNGAPCPTWDALNDAVRSHWCAVALHAETYLDGLRVERDGWKRRAERHGCNVADGDADCG